VPYSQSLSNINVFALTFILTLSYFFTFLDLVILRFFIYLSKFRKTLSPRIERWVQDDVFQLQRRAYEAIGEGTWTRLDKEIPITCEKTLLSDFAVETTPPGVLKEGVSVSGSSNALGPAPLLNADPTTDDNTSITVVAEGGVNNAIPDPQFTNEDSHPHGISDSHGLAEQRGSISDDPSTNSSINSNGERRQKQGHTNTTETSTLETG